MKLMKGMITVLAVLFALVIGAAAQGEREMEDLRRNRRPRKRCMNRS